ncbi:hypothetical protein LEP1GSC133_1704 [Leptospira borgpetersenii serovar Pomona str. 200901868]|uniref:Uncharacterized protein n=1 Tax=Leptospira borgpetersenii serovar Pomona str. 200901868 TaxID=1192866 RepID=M6VYL8_LEPBO|nr:hypothetical protein LEP1GSC133_1704 [Leptospira borgpetersenii serovar Pomona str. 200901868]
MPDAFHSPRIVISENRIDSALKSKSDLRILFTFISNVIFARLFQNFNHTFDFSKLALNMDRFDSG